MSGGPEPEEPVLGRSLAETAALNSKGYRAGEQARQAVAAAATPPLHERYRNLRRAIWIGLAALLLLAAGLVAKLERSDPSRPGELRPPDHSRG